MTEMPKPQAQRFINVREGLDTPPSRWGENHVPAEVVTDETIDPELFPEPYVAPRQVGRPALTGAEISTAA